MPADFSDASPAARFPIAASDLKPLKGVSS
jgi:hypothetical protein